MKKVNMTRKGAAALAFVLGLTLMFTATAGASALETGENTSTPVYIELPASDIDVPEEILIESRTDPEGNALNADLLDEKETLYNLLDEDDKAAITDGKTVAVWLKTRNGEYFTEEQMNQLKNNPYGYIVADKLDIRLFKQVEGEDEEEITDTNGTVLHYRILIPDELVNSDSSITRTYRVACIDENGNIIYIDGTYDKNTHMFTFTSEYLGAYALVYKDSKRNSGGSGKTEKSGSGGRQTGQQMPWMLCCLIITLSASSGYIIRRRQKKL